MPKRTRTPNDTDTDASEFHIESDASCCEEPRSRSKKTRQTRTRKRTHATRSAVQQELEGEASGSGTSAQALRPSHPSSSHIVTGAEPIRTSLLGWFGQTRETRGMPWRKQFDPSLDEDGRAQRAYEVWVSEVMLQQTQVATVIPYYTKWMAKFPTIRDLSQSDIDTVNNLWKGLGYYSRAARLLSGAQKAVKELGGRLPDNAQDMQVMIPGIGRYSAGAICSIAYNQCVPVLDGNVIRLLTRFLALYAPPKGKQAQNVLWAGAEAFVKGSSHPGDVNQALIELGSTVCKVRGPVCGDCPLRPWCRAYRRTQSSRNPDEDATDIEELCTLCGPLPADDSEAGSVTIYPMKVQRKKVREELDSVNVVEWRAVGDREGFFLLVRRPEGGLLAGLHEFPTAPNVTGASATTAGMARIPNRLLDNLLVDPPPSTHSLLKPRHAAKLGSCVDKDNNDDGGAREMRIVHVKPAGDVIHVFSHIRKTYRVQWVLLEGGGDKPPRLRQPHGVGSSSEDKPQSTEKAQTRKRFKTSDVSAVGKATTVDDARWVLLDQVEHANIGTGVMKVWNLVQALW